MATPTLRDLDRLGDEIAELSAHLDAATARLLTLIREFDARGGWNTGFRSCAAWLSWRVGLEPGTARERVRVARALGTLPRLAEALARGELSYAKVRELTRVATPETEERLLAVGQAGTASHVERIVRGWRRVDADHSPGLAARAPAAGPGVPLPRMRGASDPGASPPPLGAGRPHDALQSRLALPSTSSRGTRGGLSDRAAVRRRIAVRAAGRPGGAGGAGARPGARRSDPDAPGATRHAGAPRPRADRIVGLARGAARPGLGDRCPASAAGAARRDAVPERRLLNARPPPGPGVRTGKIGARAPAHP
jgi:hypothetical protein